MSKATHIPGAGNINTIMGEKEPLRILKLLDKDLIIVIKVKTYQGVSCQEQNLA